MKRLLRAFLLTGLTAGLLACGPPKKSVFPPTLTIQQLVTRPDGQWQLTVRIQNNSYGEMDFKSLDANCSWRRCCRSGCMRASSATSPR